MEPLNIRDEFILTRSIQKLVRPETFRGQLVAPRVPTSNRKFKMAVREADQPFGIGQFKAPNAASPIADIQQNLNDTTMTYITVLDLEEMVVLQETDQLESADALVRENKIDDVITMGRMLQLRNERLTEWMRWQAFQNTLTIEYAQGPALTINSYGTYGDAGANTHVITSGGNGSTIQRTADWNDTASSKVLTDLRAWSDRIETDSGHPASHIWMSRKTYRNFQKSAEFAEFMTFVDRQFRLVTQSDISALTDVSNFHIYPGSYKDNSGSVNKYMPDDYVFLHTDPVVDGIRIAETYDAPVVRYNAGTGRLVTRRNPGMDAEIFVDALKKEEYMRVSTARVVHLVLPECAMWIYVGA